MKNYNKGIAPIIIALIVAVVLGGVDFIVHQQWKKIEVLTFSISGNTLSVINKGEITQTLSLDEQGIFALNVVPSNNVAAFITDKDVNFDGHTDVGVLASTGYAGVNYFYDFYIFNPTTNQWEKSAVLSEFVLSSIDPVKKQIISTYKSGPGYVTDTYQWNGSTFIKTSPATTQPPITFLSPSEGGRVPAGSSLIIKWNVPAVSTRQVSFTLHLSSIQQAIYFDSKKTFAFNNGLLLWKVPTTFDELNSTPVDRDYVAYITMEDAQSKNIIAQSKNFTITPSVAIGQPNITAVSGPTSLKVGEMGTWGVEINYPVVTMDKLSFYVVWGDEKITPVQPKYVGPNTASGADDGGKFSHTYKKVGTYNPTFTIINKGNQSAKASVSVNVSE